MPDKSKEVFKVQPRHVPAANPPISEGEATISESHSQDADRHRKMPHPRSDK